MKIDATKRYEVVIDLYKHYNEVLLKGSAFIYAVISSLVVFYLTNQDVDNIIALKYLAIFTAGISSVLFLFSSLLINNVGREIDSVAGELELNFSPSVGPLNLFLKINAAFMLIFIWLGLKYLA